MARKEFTVRLEEDDIKQIDKLALKSGMARSAMGHKIITDFLNDEELDLVRHKLAGVELELAELRRRLESFHRGLATAVNALLLVGSKTDSQKQETASPTPEQISDWVKANIFNEDE